MVIGLLCFVYFYLLFLHDEILHFIPFQKHYFPLSELVEMGLLLWPETLLLVLPSGFFLFLYPIFSDKLAAFSFIKHNLFIRPSVWTTYDLLVFIYCCLQIFIFFFETFYFFFKVFSLFMAWKVSEYGVFSGPYFPAFRLEKNSLLEQFSRICYFVP